MFSSKVIILLALSGFVVYFAKGELLGEQNDAKYGETRCCKGVKAMLRDMDNRYSRQMDNYTRQMAEMKGFLVEIQKKLNGSTWPMAKNCAELRKKGFDEDGVYEINPDGKKSISVRCDMTTDGGGWTIFQRRVDGSVDFYRGWTSYRNGFGDFEGEFWLGLDKIHKLTKSPNRNTLRVDMVDTSGNSRYASYDYFSVSSEVNNFQLSLGTYSGNAGDSLSSHKGQAFSTKDKDNDIGSSNCAVHYKGAWWYHNCHYSNLNGLYHLGNHKSYADGVNWYHWKGYNYSLKKTEMKIRPSNYLK